jgi:hypothetical protein
MIFLILDGHCGPKTILSVPLQIVYPNHLRTLIVCFWHLPWTNFLPMIFPLTFHFLSLFWFNLSKFLCVFFDGKGWGWKFFDVLSFLFGFHFSELIFYNLWFRNVKNCVYNIFDEVSDSKYPGFKKVNL